MNDESVFSMAAKCMFFYLKLFILKMILKRL